MVGTAENESNIVAMVTADHFWCDNGFFYIENGMNVKQHLLFDRKRELYINATTDGAIIDIASTLQHIKP